MHLLQTNRFKRHDLDSRGIYRFSWMAVASQRSDVSTNAAEARRKRVERVRDRLVMSLAGRESQRGDRLVCD